jgi:sugar lactone lactonase YvrE
MKHARVVFAAVLVLLGGCSSPQVQPIVPRAFAPGSGAHRSPAHSKPFKNLYVANASNVTIYEPSGAVLRRISRVEPAALAFDSKGNLYVANDTRSNSSVLVYRPGTTVISRKITQSVRFPRTLAIDRSGQLYVANSYFSVGVYAAGSRTLLRKLKSFFPISIAFDAADNVDVGSSSGPYGGSNSQVAVFAHDSSKMLRTIVTGISDPQSLAFDTRGTLYVADANLNVVAAYPQDATEPLRKITNGVRRPTALSFDASGNLYVANNASSTITVYAPGKSKPLRTIASGISGPTTLILDASGTLYVANRQTVTVYAPGSSSPKLKIRKGIDVPVALALGP